MTLGAFMVSMQRWTKISAFAVASFALATVVLGFGWVVPAIEGAQPALDPNFARVVARPLALRCVEILLLSTLVMLPLVSRVGRRPASTIALLMLAAAATLRVFLLPELYAAWARVDLVANRPLHRLDEALALQSATDWVLLVTVGLSIGLLASLDPHTGRASRAREPLHEPVGFDANVRPDAVCDLTSRTA